METSAVSPSNRMSSNACVQINCSKEVVRVSISIASISACILLCTSQVADWKGSQELGSFGTGHSTTLQHPNTAADICRPLVDSVKAWESIAATEYAFDGMLDGWDSDSEAPAESAEDKYLQVQNNMYRTDVCICHDRCTHAMCSSNEELWCVVLALCQHTRNKSQNQCLLHQSMHRLHQECNFASTTAADLICKTNEVPAFSY